MESGCGEGIASNCLGKVSLTAAHDEIPKAKRCQFACENSGRSQEPDIAIQLGTGQSGVGTAERMVDMLGREPSSGLGGNLRRGGKQKALRVGAEGWIDRAYTGCVDQGVQSVRARQKNVLALDGEA